MLDSLLAMFGKPPEKCRECERLRLEFEELRRAMLDTQDKVYHWMKRAEQRARAAPTAGPSTTEDPKDVAPVSPRVQALLRRRQNAFADGDS